jgi:hypothetical protein
VFALGRHAYACIAAGPPWSRRGRPNGYGFAEDIVWEVTLKLRSDARVAWFRVFALSDESIHNRRTFAEVEEP